MITTKDLGALNELMTFENWLALKLAFYSREATGAQLKKYCADMVKAHAGHHEELLNYLKTESEKGSKK